VLLKLVDIGLGEVAARGVQGVDVAVQDLLRQRVVEWHVAIVIVADEMRDEMGRATVLRTRLEILERHHGSIGPACGTEERRQQEGQK
jgi:hypothetical protein